MANPTQTTKKGNIISGIHWNHIFGRQEGTATLKDGSQLRVWRGGWEKWGDGWLPLEKQ